MARPSKPWWWAARGRWAANVDGRRVVAPASISRSDEHDAWAWHLGVVQGGAMVSTSVVQGLAEAYLEWDESRVKLEDRSRNGYQSRLSTIQKVCNTRVAGGRFGDMDVASVKPDHLESLVAEWTRGGASPGYRRSLASSVKTVFGWAARRVAGREKLIDASPFAGASIPACPLPQERYATRREAAAWLRWLWRNWSKEYAFLQRCLIHTGARPSELTRARWGEIRWNAAPGMAILRREKWKNDRTGKARRVMIPGRLHRSLRRRRREAGDLMFLTPKGLEWTPSNLACTTKNARKAAIRAGLDVMDSGPERMTCYRWRHTAASSLLMAGVPIPTVAELLGTSPQYIVNTYGHILTSHLVDAALKLASRRS